MRLSGSNRRSSFWIRVVLIGFTACVGHVTLAHADYVVTPVLAINNAMLGNPIPSAITGAGSIAGSSLNPYGIIPNVTGFIDQGGTLAQFSDTSISGLNDTGNYVGVVSNPYGLPGPSEFVAGPSYSGLVALPFYPAGINAANQIVGTISTSGIPSGVLDVGGKVTTVLFPGAVQGTSVTAISGGGQIAGYFTDAAGTHGFVDTAGVFTAINLPGALNTFVTGVNTSGTLVGNADEGAGEIVGFVDVGGAFTIFPAASPGAEIPVAINDQGTIAGYYDQGPGRNDRLSGGVFEAMDVAVPEPGAWAVLAVGAFGLVGALWRRGRRGASAIEQAVTGA